MELPSLFSAISILWNLRLVREFERLSKIFDAFVQTLEQSMRLDEFQLSHRPVVIGVKWLGLRSRPRHAICLCRKSERNEDVFIQAFLAQARIEALDVGVLDRLARFDELQPYAMFVGPLVERRVAAALLGAGTTELFIYLHKRHDQEPSRWRIFPATCPGKPNPIFLLHRFRRQLLLVNRGISDGIARDAQTEVPGSRKGKSRSRSLYERAARIEASETGLSGDH
jgi:hypothetical protein